VRKLSRERNPCGFAGRSDKRTPRGCEPRPAPQPLGSRRAVTARAHAAHHPQASWRRMSALRANGRVR
jgi:hypothetical protein